MKKIIIFALTFVLISVFFVCPASAVDETNLNYTLGDLPVVWTSSSGDNLGSFFYDFYLNHTNFVFNDKLVIVPLVKYGSEWCVLNTTSVNNSKIACYSLSYNSSKDSLSISPGSTVSPSNGSFTSQQFLYSFSYSNGLVLTFTTVYVQGLPCKCIPYSISTGKSLSVSSLPDTIAWVVWDEYFDINNLSSVINYFQGKNVQNSDVSEGGSDFSCNAKFLCFEDYPEVSPDSFESHISSGNTGIGSVFENGHTVRFYYQDDPSYVLLGDNTSYKTYNSSYISLQIQTDDSPDTSYYIRVDRAYFNNRGSNDVVGYFFRSPCVDLIQKFAVIQPESFKRLESNSTYTYKINLSGFIPLNYFSVYNISVYSMSDGLLTSTSICYVGSDQSAEPDPSNSVDVFFKHDDGRIDGEPLIPDDSGLMEDLPDGIQDTSLKHYNSDYSYDITEITDTLETSVAQTSAFVDVLWGLVPAEIMVIIVAGVALLIILRILGR